MTADQIEVGAVYRSLGGGRYRVVKIEADYVIWDHLNGEAGNGCTRLKSFASRMERREQPKR